MALTIWGGTLPKAPMPWHVQIGEPLFIKLSSCVIIVNGTYELDRDISALVLCSCKFEGPPECMMKYLNRSVYYPLNLPYSSRGTYHRTYSFSEKNLAKMDNTTQSISPHFLSSKQLVSKVPLQYTGSYRFFLASPKQGHLPTYRM